MSIYKQLKHPDFIEDDVIDGVEVENLQLAIQAAWAVDPPFARDLAKRYGFYDKVCLCCANAPLTAFDPTTILKDAIGDLAYQLCVICMGKESLRYMRREVANFHATNPCGEIKI